MFLPKHKKTVSGYSLGGPWKFRNHCIHHRHWKKCDVCLKDRAESTAARRKEMREKHGPHARVDVWWSPPLAWYARILTGIRPAWRKLLVFLGVRPDFVIPFFTVSSERFEKSEQELTPYRLPITSMIENNSVKDIEEIDDSPFLQIFQGQQSSITQIIVQEGTEFECAEYVPGVFGCERCHHLPDHCTCPKEGLDGNPPPEAEEA